MYFECTVVSHRQSLNRRFVAAGVRILGGGVESSGHLAEAASGFVEGSDDLVDLLESGFAVVRPSVEEALHVETQLDVELLSHFVCREAPKRGRVAALGLVFLRVGASPVAPGVAMAVFAEVLVGHLDGWKLAKQLNTPKERKYSCFCHKQRK